MTTLDSVVKLNADRRALRSEKVRSVEKELLQLLRSAPRHFQSTTPLSAKQLLNRYPADASVTRLTTVYLGYTIIYRRHQGRLWRDYDRSYKSTERSTPWDSELGQKGMKSGSTRLLRLESTWPM